MRSFCAGNKNNWKRPICVFRCGAQQAKKCVYKERKGSSSVLMGQRAGKGLIWEKTKKAESISSSLGT